MICRSSAWNLVSPQLGPRPRWQNACLSVVSTTAVSSSTGCAKLTTMTMSVIEAGFKILTKTWIGDAYIQAQLRMNLMDSSIMRRAACTSWGRSSRMLRMRISSESAGLLIYQLLGPRLIWYNGWLMQETCLGQVCQRTSLSPSLSPSHVTTNRFCTSINRVLLQIKRMEKLRVHQMTIYKPGPALLTESQLMCLLPSVAKSKTLVSSGTGHAAQMIVLKVGFVIPKAPHAGHSERSAEPRVHTIHASPLKRAIITSWGRG
mmetsp:Transcript_33475/g.60020  ORF Transcript_33475/g.60020 Transcript_33475/m.60020 type:complete len:261 (+) Transcript_33475:279-1061(+)